MSQMAAPQTSVNWMDHKYEEKQKKKYTKQAVARARGESITHAESIRSMNGVVRLMCHKYGQDRMLNTVLFCEPSREVLGWQTLLEQPAYRKNNHWPGMRQCIRKGPLAQRLGELRAIFPHHFTFFPQTWYLGQESHRAAFFARLPATLPNNNTQLDAAAEAGTAAPSSAVRTYILKPSVGHQGDGICLVQEREQVLTYLRRSTRVVVQEYVERPLLLDAIKFDLRVYVLVSDINPLTVHVFREGLARFCCVEYKRPTKENLWMDHMHLTNYSLNKESPGFKEAEPYKGLRDKEATARLELGAHKRRLSTVLAQIAAARRLPLSALLQHHTKHLLRQQGAPALAPRTALAGDAAEGATPPGGDDGLEAGWDRYFWREVDRIVAMTMAACWSELASGAQEHLSPPRHAPPFHLPHCAHAAQGTRPAADAMMHDELEQLAEHGDTSSRCKCSSFPRCFQLIGYDILLDEALKPWLLEINNNPSMHCKRSALDSSVKQGVMESTLQLLGILSLQEVARANAKEPGARLGALEEDVQREQDSSTLDVSLQRRYRTFRPFELYPELLQAPDS